MTILWLANQVWVFKNEDISVIVTKLQSLRKKMVDVFFKSSEILQTAVVLDTQKTVTAKLFIERYLPKSSKLFKYLRPNWRMYTFFCHHDNTPVHLTKACTDSLSMARLKLLEQPRRCPDLVPWHFTLFPHVKMMRKRKRFYKGEVLLMAWGSKCADVT